jgi:phospholipase/carboxylesterase
MAHLALTHCCRPARPDPSRPPLLMLFHGNGGNAADFHAMWEDIDPAWLLITPNAPYPIGHNQYTWLKDAANPPADPDSAVMERIQAAVAIVRQFLHQVLAAYAPDPDHVYLAGHSQGASAAGTLGLLEPLPLAGIVMVSGYLWPPTLSLLADRAHLKSRDFFVGHGLHDIATPIELGRATRDFLATLGVGLTYREYEMGHGINPRCRKDIDTWLQERWAGST